MKNILLFNDFSPEAEHATELALLLAGKTNANLYVWDIHDNKEIPVVAEMATITINEELLDIPVGKNSWIEKLESKLNWQTGLRPAVHFIEDVHYSPEHILPLINKFDIGLLIKGLAEDADGKLHVDASVLNNSTRSGCPVMLVPEK